jgi:hypothetical protein
MSQASQQPSAAATKKQQLNIKSVIALAIVVVVLVFSLGVISSRDVACVLSAIGHGMQSAAHWLDGSIHTSLKDPSLDKSSEAIESFENGSDPDVYSPTERLRLEG